jgi:hypothetical protein
MTANHEQGRTAPDAVNILPELELDLSEGKPGPSPLGKTQRPVNLLPELSWDQQADEAVPVLQLNLSLRPGATPEELALDLFRLYTAVNRLELSYYGSGLTPDGASCDLTPAGGKMRVTFKPATPAGAWERLTRLVRTINEASSNAVDAGATLQYASIERCEARVINTAA